MADIRQHVDRPDPTLLAVDEQMEARQQSRFRPYLGMSAIGGPCDRRLWLEFRWADKPRFEARTLYMFDDGHRTEDLMAARLRMVPGITLHTVDPSTGRQFGVSDFGGHFRGHMDGAILGLLQAPKTWHVWEHKTSGEKVYKRLIAAKKNHGEKNALKKWNEQYYAQAVLYMHYTGMTRHYLTCSTPGGRETISVRTDADPAHAKRLIKRAERIIFSPSIPDCVSDDPSWWQCRFCPFNGKQCHGTKAAQVNNRTSVHAEPRPDGTWYHKGRDQVMSLTEQAKQSDDHLMHPDLIPYAKPIEADETGKVWIKYDNGLLNHINGSKGGKNCYTSAEIAAAENPLPLDDEAEMLRIEFGGSVEVHE